MPNRPTFASQLDGILRLLEKIDRALYGNGREGALEEMVHLEERLTDLIKVSEQNNKAISDLKGQVTTLFTIVKEHHDNKNLHTLWGLSTTRQAIVGIIVIFMFLHSVIGVIPEIGNLLKALLKLLGFSI